jgi:hypothetical protein
MHRKTLLLHLFGPGYTAGSLTELTGSLATERIDKSRAVIAETSRLFDKLLIGSSEFKSDRGRIR